MEQNFQTSFMPKKPMIEERALSSRPVGLLAIASIFIFFTMLLSSAGLYFYREAVKKKIVERESSLEKAKGRFEPAKILELQVLDKRLSASTDILNRHIALTPVFKVLQDLTMKSVRYTKFSYELGKEQDAHVMFTLLGQATGYRSIALQSDLLTKNKQIIDPVFSDLELDEKGNVGFELNFAVDRSFVDYKQMVNRESEDAVSTPEATFEPMN